MWSAVPDQILRPNSWCSYSSTKDRRAGDENPPVFNEVFGSNLWDRQPRTILHLTRSVLYTSQSQGMPTYMD